MAYPFHFRKEKPCKTCGKRFIATKISILKCETCRNTKLKYTFTPYDLRVLAEYKALAKKYRFSVQRNFCRIIGSKARSWHKDYWNDFRFKRHKYTTQGKDKNIAKIEKFNKEFKDGWWTLTVLPRTKTRKARFWRRYNGVYFYVIRSERKLLVSCMKNLPHCQGGMHIGDCPRHWKECLLYGK
jgi:hypothetical protein